jgi:hypothetical protein
MTLAVDRFYGIIGEVSGEQLRGEVGKLDITNLDPNLNLEVKDGRLVISSEKGEESEEAE